MSACGEIMKTNAVLLYFQNSNTESFILSIYNNICMLKTKTSVKEINDLGPKGQL